MDDLFDLSLPHGVRTGRIADWKADAMPLLDLAFAERPYRRREEIYTAGELEGAARASELAPSPRTRVGFFDGERLVGVFEGRALPGAVFGMGVTAIAPAYQRRGLYGAFLPRVIDAARAAGFLRVVSSHHADNNAILIAKLRHGFVVTGFQASLGGGLQVQLTHHLHDSAWARLREVIG